MLASFEGAVLITVRHFSAHRHWWLEDPCICHIFESNHSIFRSRRFLKHRVLTTLIATQSLASLGSKTCRKLIPNVRNWPTSFWNSADMRNYSGIYWLAYVLTGGPCADKPEAASCRETHALSIHVYVPWRVLVPWLSTCNQARLNPVSLKTEACTAPYMLRGRISNLVRL